MTDDPRDDIAARRARRRRRLASALAVALVATTVTFRRPWFAGNFGVVEPGRVYRAAQPRDEDQVRRLIRGHGLASILNLRGGSLADPWYAAEVRVTRERGVDFYDFPMSATRRPTRRELLVLLDLFGRCRYPVLIHCKSGSDRTAMASALYLMAGRGVGPERAGRAFSLAYGHVPFGGPEHLHAPFLEYGAWLKARGLPHTPERFRRWVERDYPDDAPTNAFRPLRPGPRDHLAERPDPGPPRAGGPVVR